jgi:hypothetical protein
MLATIIDFAALGKVVLYSLAAALLLTTVFTTGVLRIEGDDGRPASRLNRAIGIAAFGLCIAFVVLGLYVMFTTK